MCEGHVHVVLVLEAVCGEEMRRVLTASGRRPVVGTSTQSHRVGGWETAGAGRAVAYILLHVS